MKYTTTKATVMVVDDTPANLDLLDRILRAAGHRVLTFPRGRLALEAATESPPDLMLLDVLMPEMDGFEVCRRMKADPRLADIPVLFISALGETADKLRAFAAGGADYITKPFQEEEVLARTGVHLEIGALHRSLREQNENLERLVVERTWELAAERARTVESIVERIREAEWGKERSLGLHATPLSELEPLSSAIEELAQKAFSKEELRIRYVSDLIRVEEETRRRLARELHDGPLQSASAAIKRIQIASEAVTRATPAELSACLNTAEEIVRSAADELRVYCEELSPSWVKLGLGSAMDENAESLARIHDGVAIHIETDEMLDSLPEGHILALVRIVQEAVSNSVRHGGARSVHVNIKDEGDAARFSIQDDGIGFDAEAHDGTGYELLRTTGHRGLANINERVRLLHGTMRLESRRGEGCRIEIVFPKPRAADGN